MTSHLRARLALLGLIAVAACSEPDGPLPSGGVAMVLAVSGAAAGEVLTVSPHYRRVDQAVVPFPSVTRTLGGSGSDQVGLELDLTECLQDGQREGGGVGCPVRIALVLRSGQGDVVDSQLVGPLTLLPGATVTTPAVTLRAVGSVNLTAPVDSLSVGGSTTVAARVLDRSGGVITGKTVRWRSGNPAVVSVSQAGLVSALAPGNASIIAAVVVDSSVTGSLGLVVRGVLSVAIGADSIVLDLGQTSTPNVTVTAIGVPPTTNWRSADATIATVNPTSGLITAVRSGRTKVFAEAVADPSKRDSVVVIVRGVVSVAVTPSTIALDPDMTATATAVVTAAGGVATTVSWLSRDPSIAAVDAAGQIIALRAGVVPVVASAVADPTKRDSTIVSVRGVVSVNVIPDTISLAAGQTVTPPVTVVTVGSVSTAVTWSSSNPQVATVNPTTGLVQAQSVGIVAVVATSVADPTKSDRVFVRVAGVGSVNIVQDTIWLDLPDQETPTVSVLALDVSSAVSWASDNPSVASVATSGLVTTPGKQGRAVVTATSVADPTKRDTVVIRVSLDWTDPFRRVGSASDSAVTLALPNQVGALWTYGKRNLAAGFTAVFGFSIQNQGGATDIFRQPGGEGLALVIQNQDSVALGTGGSGLGYTNITRSLAIEFDTWASASTGDLTNNHISVHTRGLLGNSSNHAFSLASSSPTFNMSSGLTQDIDVIYVPGRLQVFVGGFAAIDLAIDLTNIGGANLLDARGRAWIGITSSTGTAFEDHLIPFYLLP